MSLTDKINAISDSVFEMEQENEHLKTELDNRKPDPNMDELLDLMQDDIEWQEAHQTVLHSDRINKIIEVYRSLRPKEGEKRD